MFLIGLIVAVFSTLLYVFLLWWLDRYEKEPWPLFLAAFAYGSVPAVILAVIIEIGLDLALTPGDLAGAGVVAPIVEEIVKGLAVLLIFFIWPREFDGVLDGIVYGAVVGLGFSMVENILYFLEPDPAMIVARTIPFGLNHAFFTAFTGLALGFARTSRHRRLWIPLFPLGLGAATLFHSLHNFSVSSGSVAGCAVALVADWFGVVVVLVVAGLSWAQERRWIRQELPEEVAAGLLAEDDYQALLRTTRRIGARLWMWRQHGWRAFRLLGRFFNLATELAFRKHHLRVGSGRRGTAEEAAQLRRQIQACRAAILGMMAK